MNTEIVVGLDGSRSAQAALRWAMDRAVRTGATVRAVHVWRIEAPEVYVPVDEMRHDREHAALADVRRWFEEATTEPWTKAPCTLEALEGAAPGPRLVALAADAEMLVLGAPEHRGLGRLLHGSVGHYALTHAGCPVVFVPAPALRVPEYSDRSHRRIEVPDYPRF